MSIIRTRALHHVATVHADWTRFIEHLPRVSGTKQPSVKAARYFGGQYQFERSELTDEQRYIGDALCVRLGARRWTVNRIDTGSMTSPHRDAFTPTAKALGEWSAYERGDFDPHERYIRYWIPINNRSIGQYFEAEGVRTLCDWRAGEVYVSPSTHTHCGATVGPEPRYLIMADGLQSDEGAVHKPFSNIEIRNEYE